MTNALARPILCAIDPGVHSTGWALMNLSDKSQQPLVRSSGVIREPNNRPWLDCADAVSATLLKLLQDNWVKRVAIEQPQIWTADSSSLASAARGDLFKLAVLVGDIIGHLRVGLQNRVEIRLVTPNEWKGQLPKPVVMERVRTILGYNNPACRLRDHETDAIAIGLYVFGVF